MGRKKILLIAPVFFDYYKDILKELRSLDYEADYLCDTYSNSSFSKALGRVDKKLIRASMKRAFSREILPKLRGRQYDFVLVVAGMTFAFSPDMTGTLRKLQPKARFVLYQWDSEENLPYVRGIHPFFDRICTFDPEDCRKSESYTFLPLFYNRQYEKIGEDKEPHEWKYDCAYIGTAHPQKYQCIRQMSKTLKPVLPRQFLYHYMPSRLKYVYHRLSAREFRGVRYAEFQKKKLPVSAAADVFEQSRCILDAPQAGQRGLTIRTIECLGAKRKLITTNADIKNYDFYRESNILIFQGKIDTDSAFFTREYEELPEEVYRKYSLRRWLETVLDVAKNEQKY